MTLSTSLHKQMHCREHHFKSEHLFRTCSEATSLVTSLEINPIRCATTLYQFGQTGNGSVATPFVLVNSTAVNIATGDNVAVPERFGQNEEPASKTKERTRNKPR